MRILMAEDNPIFRIALEAMLKGLGYETVVAANGEEALSILQGDGSPDIAILDWTMPKIEGTEVCRRIRADETKAGIYIIMLTARGEQEDCVEAFTAGADDYVRKPFRRLELAARLRVGERTVSLQRKLADRVHEVEGMMAQLRKFEQSRKLESIGQLAAGIAHEINTPTQYVDDNVNFIAEAWNRCLPILESAGGDEESTDLIAEMPLAIQDAQEGLKRISEIVRSVRDFAHPAGSQKVMADINRAVETTVTVARNEWKEVADVVLDLARDLPQVPAFAGEINQVVLNLLVNAAHAIRKISGAGGLPGTIRIETATVGDSVEIRMTDTGCGIDSDCGTRVFDPFYTTKDVGEGTGQGLAIAHSIVVKQHQGQIWFDSEVGKGTTFYVRIPRARKKVSENAPPGVAA